MSFANSPAPPRDAVMPATTQDVLLLATAVAGLLMIWLAVRASRSRGDLVPVYVLVGSILAIGYEPVGDTLLMAYYPEVGQRTWIHLFGRDMPTFVALLYVSYIGGFVLAFLRMADGGLTRRKWWTLWACTASATAVMEIVWMQFGDPWLYYGDQPFEVLGFPLWVVATNVSFLTALGVTAHGIAARFPRRCHWAAVPATAMVVAGVHATVALPGAAALYASTSQAVVYAGAIGSIALAVFLSWALSIVSVSRDAAGPV